MINNQFHKNLQNGKEKIEQIPTVGNQILMVSHFEIPNSGK